MICVETNGLIIISYGSIPITSFCIGNPSIVVSIGDLWVKSNSLVVVGERLLNHIKFKMGKAPVQTPSRVAGSKSNRLVEILERSVRLAIVQVRKTSVGVSGIELRNQVDDLGEISDSRVKIALEAVCYATEEECRSNESTCRGWPSS